jgi:hypothetical protein
VKRKQLLKHRFLAAALEWPHHLPPWLQVIYVCDDGYATDDGAAKRRMVANLNQLGAPPAPLASEARLAHTCTAALHVHREPQTHCDCSKLPYKPGLIRRFWRVRFTRDKIAWIAGHENVVYVGDRVKRGQLNGKSANLNHAIFSAIYPGVRNVADVPAQDILMARTCQF